MFDAIHPTLMETTSSVSDQSICQWTVQENLRILTQQLFDFLRLDVGNPLMEIEGFSFPFSVSVILFCYDLHSVDTPRLYLIWTKKNSYRVVNEVTRNQQCLPPSDQWFNQTCKIMISSRGSLF